MSSLSHDASAPSPSEARDSSLDLHSVVRRALGQGLNAVHAARAGEPDAASRLRQAALGIAAVVRRQIRAEDVTLAPILEKLDAWGPERVRLLESAHAQERAAVSRALEPAAEVSAEASELEAAIRQILRALRLEERELLDADGLDDSTIVNPYQGGS